MEEMVTARAIISGRVQGVCFRMETKQAAESIGVSGWVRNLADGTVEALFEGEKADVDAALAWCEKGPPMSAVTNMDIEWGAYSGRFTGFDITF